MSFLLDTNILSRTSGDPPAWPIASSSIRAGSTHPACRWRSCMTGYGRRDPDPLRASIQRLLQHEVSLIPFDADCAEEFGRVRAGLRPQGISVDNMDLLIGATALVYDLTVVTHNTADFQHIPGLRLEDWLTP